MKDIRQDLEDRLALFDLRHNIVFALFGGDDLVGGPEMYAYIAGKLEEGLHEGSPDTVKSVRALIDPGELDSAKFWGTPLGVLLFSAGGYVPLACPQTVAAAVLRCSRQYVHELIVSGKLLSVAPPVGSTSGRMVESAGVRVLVMKKLDRLVN